MVKAMLFYVLVTIFSICSAMYGPSSDVISANDKTFKKEVLGHPGIVIVEFYAPWCGHCKSLEPEYEKAATTLKGVVKVVAVDATEATALASTYSVQGFPTLKIFGADKKKPIPYEGQRTADAIITETMKSVNSLVKSRKAGGGKKSSGSSSSSSGSGSGSGSGGSGGSGKKGASDVVELTADNFQSLVLDSSDAWMIEFYAPWCGHCKQLAPQWERAATQLKGVIRLGAVDATVHGSLASEYDVKGYPTIKEYSPATKRFSDYSGAREAEAIIENGQRLAETAAPPAKVEQVTDEKSFLEKCGAKGKACVMLFVPHIYDSSAKQRKQYISQLQDVAKSFRGKPLLFGWTEGGAQESLERAVEVNGVYPGLAVLTVEKKVYATLRLSLNEKNIKAFLNGVLSRTEKNLKLSEQPKIVTVSAWDGKDAAPPVEEPPLDADWNSDSAEL